jgi:hypothetical protein
VDVGVPARLRGFPLHPAVAGSPYPFDRSCGKGGGANGMHGFMICRCAFAWISLLATNVRREIVGGMTDSRQVLWDRRAIKRTCYGERLSNQALPP